MKLAYSISILCIIVFKTFPLNAQESVFRYELDLTKKNDAFNVILNQPELGPEDKVYSFVSFAPGVHQPLDFGRFIRLFKVFDKNGEELMVQKISLNDFRILEPEKVERIIYEIDDSFDMSIEHHPVYPMSGTGINKDYTVINTHGVFGYFEKLKDRPIELKLKLDGDPKVGTSLHLNNRGVYEIDSYYQFTDSPILIGDSLSYASVLVDEMKVEAYVHSKNNITASMILEQAQPILNAAKEFIGYSPVDRYTFLFYFADHQDVDQMKVFNFGGALEHSLSSTYALPDNPEYLHFLKDIIAHEFMHILSPLHLHSDVLANFDYSDPVSNDMHVWLYEGVTEWVSYKMQLTSGLVSFEDYLNYLTEKINKSQDYRSDYSLLRISKEWSTDEGNKQYGNIYQLGALTAAMLDLKLLDLSDGKKGLREVYLELISSYGKDKPFDNNEFFDEFVQMTYPQIAQFIENHIKNNTAFNFKELLGIIGVTYIEQRRNIDNLPVMGLMWDADKAGNVVIKEFSPEYKGDLLQVGDKIVRVLNKDFNNTNYRAIMDSINAMKVGDSYTIDIIRDENKLQITETLYAKIDRNVLVASDKTSDRALKLRAILQKN